MKQAAFDFSTTSALGPDDFGGEFFQSAWEIIIVDMVNVVGFFFTRAFAPAGLNSNIVTLIIPKSPGASKVEEFWSIVYGNFLFKVFTKIISSRLGSILKHMLSSTQYGFISGKIIHHGQGRKVFNV